MEPYPFADRTAKIATYAIDRLAYSLNPPTVNVVIDFDGGGTLVSPFATVSINGTIIRSSGTPGTYAINADCTGTVSFTGGPSFDIFVDPKGNELWMIQTGGAVPAVFEGIATRVSR